MNVFRDGDEIDMYQVHKALQEMCEQEGQHESAQHPRVATAAPREQPADNCTPSSVTPAPHTDTQAGPSGIGSEYPGFRGHTGSAAAQSCDVCSSAGKRFPVLLATVPGCA